MGDGRRGGEDGDGPKRRAGGNKFELEDLMERILQRISYKDDVCRRRRELNTERRGQGGMCDWASISLDLLGGVGPTGKREARETENE